MNLDRMYVTRTLRALLQSAETVVHSAYYRLASEYYKAVGPPDAFYRSALMFLAYTPLESIPADERYALATDISLAALTGEGVFNFGEVVSCSRMRI